MNVEIDVLSVLDQMDKVRRDHYFELPPPADCYFRIMEAIVAKAAGYESRNAWIDELKQIPGSEYTKDINNSDYWGTF